MKVFVSILVALTTAGFVSTNLLGGLNSISNDDVGVLNATTRALNFLKERHNGNVNLERIISAKLKILAGVQYQLKVEINIDNTIKECNFIVTRLVYLDQWSVTGDDCLTPEVVHLKKRSARLLGGVEDMNMNDKYVQKAANWAVDHINSRSNSMNRLGLKKIADGSRQVVNGYKYKFLLYLVSTSCRNERENFGKTLDDCPAEKHPMQQQCDVSVLFSRGKYSMLNMECKPLKLVLGGDDHDYQNHGKENLIGGGSHDYVLHGQGKKVLGGDGHDYKSHGQEKKLLGGGDHDYLIHGISKKLFGGDGHDYKSHGQGKKLLGRGDHDYKSHGQEKKLLGGGDHDYLRHGISEKLFGGDGHDYLPQGEIKHLLGVDGHDYKAYKKVDNLLGGDMHDYISHVNKLKGLINTMGSDSQKEKVLKIGEGVLHRTGDIIKDMGILGGDSHDYQPHVPDQCEEHRKAFEEFKSKHQRLYSSPKVESERFQIFCGNMEKVKEYKKMERGSAVYGATQFADISETEFKNTYLGWKPSLNNVPEWPEAKIPEDDVPEAFDWRDHGAVTPVKNQGSCGSCWAFSTTGNIEGLNAIKHKKLVSLSEQELLDCDKVDQACNGGLPSQAYEAIIKLGGIETEKDYSYDAEEETCKFSKSKIAAKVVGAMNISQNEADIAAWLVKNGPISIGINAFAMQFYMGGIAHPWKIFCNPHNLDHGVLIVGYGKDGNEPYWIVKNSWGPGWGRQGYYYVYRGDGTCGLNTMCTSAVVA